MILAVTINPLLEKRLYYPKIKIGSENRSDVEKYTAGGKGINVSRQLNKLNIKNMTVTFLGGNNGKIIKGILADEKINYSFVQTKAETRSASLIVEQDPFRVTTFFGPNSIVTDSETSEFKQRLKKMIENCEIVIFSGSSSCAETDSIFPYGIEIANEFDKISICDTYGTHLKNCLEKSPTIIHNNFNEITRSLNVSLDSESNAIEFLQSLYRKGIKQAYLTNGPENIYASNFDFMYKAECPKINEIEATGSGDAFTAGLAYGLHNSLTFEETFISAISLGAANAAKPEVCNVALDEFEPYKASVKVESIGKKINLLN